MADLAINGAQVQLVSGDVDQGVAGEVCAVGNSLYYSETLGTWLKAQCDGTAVEAGLGGVGIALASALAVGNRIGIAKPGAVLNLGAAAAPAAGTVYVVGAAAGAIAPVADLVTSGHKITIIGIGIGSNQIMVTRVYNGGAVKP